MREKREGERENETVREKRGRRERAGERGERGLCSPIPLNVCERRLMP